MTPDYRWNGRAEAAVRFGSIVLARRSGGTVLGEPMEIPAAGMYVSFTDTEGNRIGLLQPVPRNRHAPTVK